MRAKHQAAASALLSIAILLPGAGCAAASATPELDALARTALRGAPHEAAAEIDRLREAGAAGMAAALAIADRCREGQAAGDAGDAATIASRLDRVCGVADCGAIRLFWYTDLEAAKAEAQAAGKPILSLRLLGRLDEELSCANSRFFRTVLYPNREIGELLREQYVLHWESLRPVPKVTIEFGDGRKLEQTVTGNSVHYVLDSRGRLLDVLPGLYGPATFRRELAQAAADLPAANRLDEPQFAAWARKRFQGTERRLDAALEAKLAVVTPLRQETAVPTAASRDPWQAPRPTVKTRVVRDTASKSGGEISLYRALDRELEATDAELERLAGTHRAEVRLDEASRAFLLAKHGVTDRAAGAWLIESFERTLALDEVMNEFRHRRQVLRRLIRYGITPDLDLADLNVWIYDEVFGADLSDPWMGLQPEEVYMALPPSTRVAPPPPPPPPQVSDALFR